MIYAGNKPSKKKEHFPVQKVLKKYLLRYDRYRSLPIEYQDLLRYTEVFSLLDQQGNDTHWKTVAYAQNDLHELNLALTSVYALLKNDGDMNMVDHLSVARIDFCVFGNSQPFRVRIINRLNDNYDHFYVKKADASRIYGLELEDILSPNKMRYLVDNETLIEEHIAGIPGDDFMKNHLIETEFNETRISKEFVKFNERCFVRLLGDMRSYNFVVDITPDIEGAQYRIRAIDFDQQSYEGKKSFYLPQYFKENNPIIFLGIKHMTPETVKQYQHEERSLIAARIKNSHNRLQELLSVMRKDRISKPKKIRQLRKELAEHHQNNTFLKCKNMGEIVAKNIERLLKKDFKQSIIV